jgi:hypothetical protein
MDQERLNHVMVLHTYKERVDHIDVEKLLKDFIGRNDMRKRKFSVVNQV